MSASVHQQQLCESRDVRLSVPRHWLRNWGTGGHSCRRIWRDYGRIECVRWEEPRLSARGDCLWDKRCCQSPVHNHIIIIWCFSLVLCFIFYYCNVLKLLLLFIASSFSSTNRFKKSFLLQLFFQSISPSSYFPNKRINNSVYILAASFFPEIYRLQK